METSAETFLCGGLTQNCFSEKQYFKEFNIHLSFEVMSIANDGTSYQTDLTGLLTKASHLQELLIKCQEAARGEENGLTKKFGSHLSKML